MIERRLFELNWKTFWQIFAFLVVLVVLYLGRQAFGVLLVAIVISIGLDPLVSFLERKRFPRLLGAILVFLAVFLLFAAVIYFIIPAFLIDLGGFLDKLNKVLVSTFGIGFPQAMVKNLSFSLDRALSILNTINISLTGAISAVLSRAVFVLATIMISFYLTVEKDGTDRLLRVILPDVYERSVLSIFTEFKTKIHRWFAAQAGLSLIIGVLVVIGLWLLGVPYALVLGALAALFEIVPVIGPIITGLVAFLVASTESLTLGLYALLFFFIIQQIENHVLVPLVMGKAMKVHPVIVIISLLAGAQIAGFVGIVLSIPIAVLVQEIFIYLARSKDQKTALGI